MMDRVPPGYHSVSQYYGPFVVGQAQVTERGVSPAQVAGALDVLEDRRPCDLLRGPRATCNSSVFKLATNDSASALS
jgi:hypothetical protein